MPEDKEKLDPRWDVINKLYDAIDNDIVDISDKEKMNFIEIGMALHMINKKIEYEQFKVMFEFNVEGLQKNAKEKDQPKDLYR